MELSRRFKNKTLFLDTAPIIYFIEKNPRYNELLKTIISLIDSRSAKGVTSTVTLLEVLVKPLRDGDKKLAEKYKTILLSANGLLAIEITHEISIQAAGLRALYNIRTPDSIQLAAAIALKADYFITNDHALKQVKEIKTILLDEML